jgi:alkylated DNA nucleotide flippase Atl1
MTGQAPTRRGRPAARRSAGPQRAVIPDEAGPDEAGPDDYASRVLEVTESIPPGRVMSYGDVAEYLGQGGPRQVGRVMSLWGGGVTWWRVVHADGSLLAGHEQEALRSYRAERTPLRPPGPSGLPRIDMRRARWDGLTAA